MKILLGDFDAKVCMEDIFKLTDGNESLHEINIDIGIKGCKVCHIQKSDCRTFPHNIHKFSWTPPDGKTHSQIEHNLIDGRRYSVILNI
jgi:hypothetical protein